MNMLDRCRYFIAEGLSDVAAMMAVDLEWRQNRVSPRPKQTTQTDDPLAQVLWDFVDRECHAIPGAFIRLTDFYKRFEATFPPGVYLAKSHVVGLIRSRFLYGAYKGATRTIGNVSFNPAHPVEQPFVLCKDRLRRTLPNALSQPL